MTQKFEIEMLPVLDTNYAIFVKCRTTGKVAMVDAPDDDKIFAFLEQKQWRPSLVLVTHRHWDHVDGLEKVKDRYNPLIVVPEAEKDQISPHNETISPGAILPFGAGHFTVLSTPGHTSGHIAYYLQEQPTLFAGDALFSIGCGRMFDGPADAMWEGLKELRRLPDETTLYCGHEYTRDNVNFALSLTPEHQALRQHLQWVEERRAQNQPTLPSTLGFEKANNPFLRADDPEVAKAVGQHGAPKAEVFAAIRKAKDQF
ncbi:hydroxyacylglutathione hydrolase [Maritalea mediterranea]|uniref:Hydroxyacylglutathione hydrolase n=1 Tax=Maritalea mediterranea TaxID=2909667 RepID=A0ABS9EB40_9HYPH|nr:hydroxyacylglutathione hydrolase [Maritalea mediterranea]MCF4099399.1 hydroxyacylglutathione hydrolase [Maritalea mediterranea]